MGKRMMVNFGRAGFPHYEEVEEEGMAKPCAIGLPWVNPDTVRTLALRRVRRTGPKGEALEAAQAAPGTASASNESTV